MNCQEVAAVLHDYVSGELDGAESEEIFQTLVRRNAINMHSPVCVAGVTHRSQTTDGVRRQVAALVSACLDPATSTVRLCTENRNRPPSPPAPLHVIGTLKLIIPSTSRKIFSKSAPQY